MVRGWPCAVEWNRRQEVVMGIHHVTAIAGDPQRNIDFYAGCSACDCEGHRQLRRSRHVPLLLRRRSAARARSSPSSPGPRVVREGRGQGQVGDRFAEPSRRLARLLAGAAAPRGFATRGRPARFDEQVLSFAITTACCWRSSPLPESTTGRAVGRRAVTQTRRPRSARGHHLGGWGPGFRRVSRPATWA